MTPPTHPRATHRCPDFTCLGGHNWREWTLLAHSFVLQPFNCPSFVLVCFVCIFWPCITLKWPCIIFWTVSIWGRNPSWQVQQKLQFNGCISNCLKAGFEVLRHHFQHFWDHNTAEDVQACVIYVCLQLYCCLDLNRGSDSISVCPILGWYKTPKGASEVGNLLVEKFASAETNLTPLWVSGTCWGWQQPPRWALLGRGATGRADPARPPQSLFTVINQSKRPHSRQSKVWRGRRTQGELYLFREWIPLWRRGLATAGGEIACRVLPAPAPLRGAHRLRKACLLL